MSKSKAASTGKKAPSPKARSSNGGKPKTASPTDATEGETLVAERKPAAGGAASSADSRNESVLPEGYRPSDDEPFMNARQRL